MAVTPEQYESIKRWRELYFRSTDGRATLHELLEGLGLFRDANVAMRVDLIDQVVVGQLFAGLAILKKLGVWDPDMFESLIEAMAAMPMPDVENQ